ncbi:hypothetical protein QZH41_002915 [Actinostola sp. cb2023]|nr:hypothetical protein QZH41_002915 [Actinostola sp. cb2023]
MSVEYLIEKGAPEHPSTRAPEQRANKTGCCNRKLPDGYPTDTRRIPDGYTTDTRRIHNGYPTDTRRIHDGYPSNIMNRSNNTSSLNDMARQSGPIYDRPWVFAGVGIYVPLSISITLGNALVIAAFFSTPKLKTKTNYFIVSLAVADLIVGTFSVPMWTYILITEDFENPVYRVYQAVDMVSGVSSILHLTCISLERCYAIVAPLQHMRIKKAFIHGTSYYGPDYVDIRRKGLGVCSLHSRDVLLRTRLCGHNNGKVWVFVAFIHGTSYYGPDYVDIRRKAFIHGTSYYGPDYVDIRRKGLGVCSFHSRDVLLRTRLCGHKKESSFRPGAKTSKHGTPGDGMKKKCEECDVFDPIEFQDFSS